VGSGQPPAPQQRFALPVHRLFSSLLLPQSLIARPPPAGHTYVAFGPLLMGARQVLFEGVPTFPDAGRCWEVVDKYQVGGG
jgi:hypothetical protein